MLSSQVGVTGAAKIAQSLRKEKPGVAAWRTAMSATSLVQGHDNRSPQQQYRCAISKGAILPLSSTGEALAKSQNYRLDAQMRLIEHCGCAKFSPKQR
jgi:hypothetical protein